MSIFDKQLNFHQTGAFITKSLHTHNLYNGQGHSHVGTALWVKNTRNTYFVTPVIQVHYIVTI